MPVFPSSDTECLNIPRLKSVDFVSGTYKVRNTYRDKLSFDSYKTFIVINPFEYNQK